jgi:hypothetical protein
MTRRAKKMPLVHTITFVRASDVFSHAEIEVIEECANNVTWGDANHTMVRADNEIFDEVREHNPTLDADLWMLTRHNTYIDMEN